MKEKWESAWPRRDEIKGEAARRLLSRRKGREAFFPGKGSDRSLGVRFLEGEEVCFQKVVSWESLVHAEARESPF